MMMNEHQQRQFYRDLEKSISKHLARKLSGLFVGFFALGLLLLVFTFNARQGDYRLTVGGIGMLLYFFYLMRLMHRFRTERSNTFYAVKAGNGNITKIEPGTATSKKTIVYVTDRRGATYELAVYAPEPPQEFIWKLRQIYPDAQ